jgi:hypothetical protein
VQQRRRVKQLLALGERLEQEAARLRAKAKKLPLGPKREELIRKARHAEMATQMDALLTSPGLRVPR